jgi:hypothetical protein
MTTESAGNSATPILDLRKPLPTPDAERFTGRFALPFLTAVAFVVFTGNLSFLMVLFGVLLVNFLVIAVHEFGHLIAGRIVGLPFTGVTIGPFVTRFRSGKWELKLRPRVSGGLAFMGLARIRRVRRRLIVLVAGGPASSLLFGFAALFGGELARARYDSPWPTFFEFFGVFSLFIGFLALLPIRAGRYAGDGMQLRALLFSKSDAKQMIASHALASLKNYDLFPPDYFRRWWRMASAETPVQYTRFHADWLEYEDAKDSQVAAESLERCLADSAILDHDGRSKLLVEAAVFNACCREDNAKAKVWSERCLAVRQLGPLDRMRIEIALFYSSQHFDEALASLARGLSMIRSAAVSNERNRCETAWEVWRQQIEQRIPVAVASSTPSLATRH